MTEKVDQGVVVVPWNFSRICRAGLDQAVRMSIDSKRIHVVHVAEPLSGPDNGALYAAAEKRKCQDLERRFRNRVADDSKLSGITFHVLFGNPGTQIASYADRYEAELIVVPSPEKPKVLDFLFGGLAKQVMKHARRPVVVVHENESSTSLQAQPHFSSSTACRIDDRKRDLVNAG